MKYDPVFIKEETLKIVSLCFRKITPLNLEKTVCEKFALKKKTAKQIIKEMVSSEELAYVNLYGLTFIEKSFGKPVNVGSRIILSPPDRNPMAKPGEVIVNIMGGASFGSGDHATTRLCLQGLEQVMERHGPTNRFKTGSCLDIGTGSGVLVIAAVKLGMAKGMGLDMDPNALSESQQNVTLNGLDYRIRIGNFPLESLAESFPLILANLRFPTLLTLSSKISTLCEPTGLLVLSGFRPEEFPDLLKAYERAGFEETWHGEEKNWGATALKNKG